jgi:hypothetical protein
VELLESRPAGNGGLKLPLLLSVERNLCAPRQYRSAGHDVIAIIMIKKLPQSYCRLLVDGGIGNGPRLINELQMADRLLPKPQGWRAEKGPDRAIPPTAGRDGVST